MKDPAAVATVCQPFARLDPSNSCVPLACPPGSRCARCTSAGECLECEQGFALRGAYCLPTTPDLIWDPRTMSDISSDCAVIDCEYCDLQGACHYCRKNFSLTDGGQCVASETLCGAAQFLLGQSCVDCPTPCLACLSADLCLRCGRALELVGGKCLDTHT